MDNIIELAHASLQRAICSSIPTGWAVIVDQGFMWRVMPRFHVVGRNKGWTADSCVETVIEEEVTRVRN